MKTYISILRGINVGGNRVIRMEALRQMYESVGFDKVQSYIQSGNVIFQYKDTPVKELASKISYEIGTCFGFDVPVIVVELKDLDQMVADNPFSKDPGRGINCLHVTFLSETPNPERFGAIRKEYCKNDEYLVVGRVIYLYCPGGYGKTGLTNGFFENLLDVSATTRNWKTTLELLNIARKIMQG